MLDHPPKNEETADTSNTILDELIEKIRTKNNNLKTHLNQENQAIEDLICKKYDEILINRKICRHTFSIDVKLNYGVN